MKFCLFLIFIFGCSSALIDPKPAAEKEAVNWFSYLDRGYYQKVFLESSSYLRDRLNRGTMEDMLTQRQMILGKIKNRAKAGEEIIQEYRGLGPGEYVAFFYNSEFEQRKQVSEKVLLKKERGHWKVFEYFFY